MAMETFSTDLTKMFNITHPIILAGMNVAAGPELAATVTNCGGMGVIGGVGYTPKFLRQQIKDLKALLNDKNAPFGIDLLLPKVGEGARKTNYDYTKGQLPELVDICIEEKCALFVSAVGVPPKWAVDKFHAAGIPVANMIGSPKHVKYALDAGCDIICAQGGEGGGHTGEIATSILIPAVVDLCKGAKSPLTGGPVSVIAAGGIHDSRGLAMALSLGASAVWVGTRFVAAKEAGAPPVHQKSVVTAGYHDTVRTIIFTGRPMRVRKNEYIMDWENNRADEIKELTSKGVLPNEHHREKLGDAIDMKQRMAMTPMLMGQAAGAITSVIPAKEIMDEMVSGAIAIMRKNVSSVITVKAPVAAKM